MIIKGIDFTSSPSRKKPITCAICSFEDSALTLQEIKFLTDFSLFESEISSSGEWVAGLDFPFGQSRKFVENIGWPNKWEDYIKVVSSLSRDEFISTLENYKKDRKVGDKEHRRHIDVLAKSISPQKLYGVPVGKMFYEGAKRLINSPATVIPFQEGVSGRIIFEAYPAIIARKCVGKNSYKSDTKSQQTKELELTRKNIVDSLQSNLILEEYGFNVVLGEHYESMASDATGDTLDAVLCSIQAAWGYLNKDNNYGVPKNVNLVEGWIVDPMFLEPGK